MSNVSTNRRDLSRARRKADKEKKPAFGREGCDEAIVWTAAGLGQNKDIFVFYLSLSRPVFFDAHHYN